MKIRVNRAPVLTLWAAVVAERLGHDRDTALTLGRAIAGYAAYAKAKSLGLADDREAGEETEKKRAKAAPQVLEFMGRRVPVAQTPQGLRALDSSGKPMSPAAVERYIAGKLGDAAADVRGAMASLAGRLTPAVLRAQAFHLYEAFRPEIPAGVKGWGAAGELDLERIASARPAAAPRSRA